MIEAQISTQAGGEIVEFVRGIDEVGVINIQKLLGRISERFPAIYRDAEEYYNLLNNESDKHPDRRKRIREIDEKYRGEDLTIWEPALLLDRTIILLGDLARRKQLTD